MTLEATQRENPTSTEIENERLMQALLTEEVDSILDAQTEQEMDQLLTFGHLVKVAARINPNLRPIQTKMGPEISAIDQILGSTMPLWVQWGVLKTLVWEQEGPTKYGQIFQLTLNQVQSQTQNLPVPSIVSARAILDHSLPPQ